MNENHKPRRGRWNESWEGRRWNLGRGSSRVRNGISFVYTQWRRNLLERLVNEVLKLCNLAVLVRHPLLLQGRLEVVLDPLGLVRLALDLEHRPPVVLRLVHLHVQTLPRVHVPDVLEATQALETLDSKLSKGVLEHPNVALQHELGVLDEGPPQGGVHGLLNLRCLADAVLKHGLALHGHHALLRDVIKPDPEHHALRRELLFRPIEKLVFLVVLGLMAASSAEEVARLAMVIAALEPELHFHLHRPRTTTSGPSPVAKKTPSAAVNSLSRPSRGRC
mmetsp:Transcript_4268/g.15282  ORF Transcript_4268/g.15282 Transcript_4268/m.15282 type:complete len:278 (-) Transcript_4268:218-1051(-)